MHAEATQILRRWTRQFGLMLAIYTGAIGLAVWSSSADFLAPERMALGLAPVVPGLAIIWLTVRVYQRCDEFIQMRVLQAASTAAVVVAVICLVSSFLEPLGFPRLSAAWVSNIIWAVFAGQMVKLLVLGR
jgi:hypothetical protein